MVITDKYVYIHQPKTGGTFVTSALMKIHAAKWGYWPHLKMALTGYIRYQGPMGPLEMRHKHGGCQHIPAKHKDKDIFSTMRNPYDWYVSQYEFGWWKRRQWLKYYRQVPEFADRFSTFPNLSFEQYLELMIRTFNPGAQQEFNDPDQIGHFTTSFLRLFGREPEELLARLDEHYIAKQQYQQDLYPVHFIFTGRLNQQLYHYLNRQGYPAERVKFILSKGKVLPLGRGRTKAQKWEKYYTPELKQLVRRKDRLLFELFPHFDEY